MNKKTYNYILNIYMRLDPIKDIFKILRIEKTMKICFIH